MGALLRLQGEGCPGKVHERLFNPVDHLGLEADAYQEACSFMYSFLGRGAWKGEEKDQ